MSSIASSLEKGNASYQAPQPLNLPGELLSLLIGTMDVRAQKGMACTSKEWRALIVAEVKCHFQQRAMRFINFVKERVDPELTKLKRVKSALILENEQIDYLLGQIEKKKASIRKLDELDTWLLDVYADLRHSSPSNLSGIIRDHMLFLELNGKGPVQMLASQGGLLVERKNRCAAQLVNIRAQITIIDLMNSKISEAEETLFSKEIQETSLVEDRVISSLSRALAFSHKMRHLINYDYYTSRFIARLKEHLPPEVVERLGRELHLGRDSCATPLVLLHELRAPHQLDDFLVRSEIAQFRGIKNFESEKNSWVQRLMMVADYEQPHNGLRKLLINPAIQNSETLLDAIEKNPAVHGFIATYVLKKIEIEIRENAFLDIISLPMHDLDPSDHKMVKNIATRTIERLSRPGEEGSATWRESDMGPVIRNLLAYNLVDRTEELARPGSSRSQEVLLLLVDHYRSSDIQKSGRYYLDYLSGLKGPIEIEQIKKALELELPLSAAMLERVAGLPPSDKIDIHLKLAKNAQQKGLHAEAIVQLNSAIEQFHLLDPTMKESQDFAIEITARLKKSGQSKIADKWVEKIKSSLTTEQRSDFNYRMLESFMQLNMVDEVLELALAVRPRAQHILGVFALSLMATDVKKGFAVGKIHGAVVHIQSHFASLQNMPRTQLVESEYGVWDAKTIFNIGLELEQRRLLDKSDESTMYGALLFLIQQSSLQESLELLERIPDKYREGAKHIIALLNWETSGLQEHLGIVGNIDFIKELIARCHYKEMPALIRKLNPMYRSECAEYALIRINLSNTPVKDKEDLETLLEIKAFVENS